MIKFGIVSRDQIRAHAKELRSGRRFSPFLAFTLLRDFDENLSGTGYDELDLVYGNIPGGPRLIKGTAVDRYDSVDGALVEEMEKIFPADCPLRVHDMAASSAITSLDFFERLKHRNNVRFHATDYYDALYAVAVLGSRWEVVFDAEHRPLQFVGKRMVIQASGFDTTARIRYPINWAMQRILLAALLPKALAVLEADAAKDGAKNGDRVQRIRLFHPRCIAATRGDSRFTLGRDDLFDPASGSYEVVRAMGVARFLPPDRIEPMFRAVSEHIVEGGLLIVGGPSIIRSRTSVPTSIFQRRGGRFVLIRDVVDGYPHKKLLLGLDLTANAGSPN